MAEFYSPQEIATLLRVSPVKVVRWIESEGLEATRTPGGHRRIAPNALRNFLRARGTPIPAELAPARLCLLVIDDEPLVLRAVRRHLRAVDPRVEVLPAANVAEGLLALVLDNPDGVLIDVTELGLGGLETLAQAARWRKLGGVPLLAMSAHWSEKLEREAIRLGATACLEKPVDGKRVLELLEA